MGTMLVDPGIAPNGWGIILRSDNLHVRAITLCCKRTLNRAACCNGCGESYLADQAALSAFLNKNVEISVGEDTLGSWLRTVTGIKDLEVSIT